MIFDPQSEACLEGVHPDLVAVVRKARETCPFRITEGVRSLARQRQLVAQKKSQTLKSRHLTGHAVDLVDMAGSYREAEMKTISEAMKAAATDLGVKLVWGGDWTSLHDTPHFELERHAYPESDMASRIKNVVLGTGVGTGATMAVPSIPAVPDKVTTMITNAEAHMAIGARLGALVKGVMTFELASMIGLAGILIATASMLFIKGGADAGAGD
jgi:peptidoglycan LD-endopeptidase CwlK